MNTSKKDPQNLNVPLKSQLDVCDPGKKRRIFISYGHDEYIDVAKHFKTDLENRGHDVWFDEDKLKIGKSWEEYIEKGINWVGEQKSRGRIVLLMTPHSVRRPDGFCLNELSRALDRDLEVIPIMVVQVEPPLCICRIQWLNLTDCIPIEERAGLYENKFNRLINALENNALDFEGIHNAIRNYLKPLNYCADIKYHLPRFTGRTWLFTMIRAWLTDENASRVFFITGDPGVGKSAIASKLCTIMPEIMAFHVCRFGDQHKRDPKQTLFSIVYQLSTQFPGLFEHISNIGNLDKICESPSVSTIFERLLVDPLHCGVQPNTTPVVILIDALDEATFEQTNELAEFLAEEMERLPKWVRFILTSRPEAEVTQPLQAYTPFYITSDSKDNQDDIKNFIRNELRSFEPDDEKLELIVTSLTEQSEYLFLYVEEIRKEIQEKRLDISRIHDFPRGLGGYFKLSFDRKFKDIDRYNKVHRPIFAVIASAYEPLSMDVLSKIFKLDAYKSLEIQEEWGSFFPVKNNKVSAFHKSLTDWMTDKNKAGSKYYVDPPTGNKKLAQAGWDEFKKEIKNMTDYFKANLPSHLESAGEKEKLQQCVTDSEFIYHYNKTGRLFELARYWKKTDPDLLHKMCLESWEKAKNEDKDYVLIAARCLGKLFQNRGDYETALFYFGKELEMAENTDQEIDKAEAIYNIAWCSRHIDEFDTAIEQAEKARLIFEKNNKRSGVANCLSVKGICYWHKQEDEESLKELHHALDVFKETNDIRNQAQALNHLGIVYRSIGQYRDALDCLEKTMSIYEKLHAKKGQGKCLNSIGTCLWWSGEHDKAIKQYLRANQINDEIDQPYVLGLTANNLGYIYFEKDELQKAHAAFSKAIKIRQKLRIESYEMMDLSGLALVNFHLGHIDEARKQSEKVIKTLKKYDTVEDLRRAYYNHYVIMKEGSKKEKNAAIQALAEAKNLVNKRLKRITNIEIKKSIIQKVPLMQEILETEKSGS